MREINEWSGKSRYVLEGFREVIEGIEGIT